MIICMDDILEKIKREDFEISYEDAIDLVKIFDCGVSYHWVETIGDIKSRLMYVTIDMLSNVKLHIKKSKGDKK